MFGLLSGRVGRVEGFWAFFTVFGSTPKPLACSSYTTLWIPLEFEIWVVVKIMVPFWVPIIIRHLLFRVPKRGTIILTTTHMFLTEEVLEPPASGWL